MGISVLISESWYDAPEALNSHQAFACRGQSRSKLTLPNGSAAGFALFARDKEQVDGGQCRRLGDDLRPGRRPRGRASQQLAASPEGLGLFALRPRLLAEGQNHRRLMDATGSCQGELNKG